MRRLLALAALLALAGPPPASAQVPLVTLTYHVEGCESGTGLLLQPVFVCGHLFQATPGLGLSLSQQITVDVTLGSAVEGIRFGVGVEGVNLGFEASGPTGHRFQLVLGSTGLLACQRSGSVTFANPQRLSPDPRIHGLAISQGSTFSSEDPFYVEGPFVNEVGPGGSESLLFDIDSCIPGELDLHVERLDRLQSLVGTFEAVSATLTGLPANLDLFYREAPTELLLDLSHDSEVLAGLFVLDDGGTLVVGKAPKAVSAEVSRTPSGSITGVAFAFTNTPAGGSLFEYDGSLLGEVSGLVVDRITGAGVSADLVERRFTFGDPLFSGGPARFDRREGILLVGSGGPDAPHEITLDVIALSVFEASVDAGDDVAVTLDHDGLLEATATLPGIGSFAIGKLRSAGFFLDSANPAFVLEDPDRSGGFARFDGRDGTLLVDLATTDGLTADVTAVEMDQLRAVVDVADEIGLLVDHVGRMDVTVEAPSLGRFDITRLPAHILGSATRDGAGDLERLLVEASGGTLETRITAATSVAGSGLTGTLGAIVAAALELDRTTDLVSLAIDYAMDVGDLVLDLAGATEGQTFTADVDGTGLSDLSLLMSLDTSEKVDVELDHVGRLDFDVDFPGLAQVVATALPRQADFEMRRDSSGDLAAVDVDFTQGSGDSRIDAWADLDDVAFFARFDDIGSGGLLADLANDRIDVDFRFATPQGFVAVDGEGNFDGQNVNFTLSSVDLNRAQMGLAGSGPLRLGANGSRSGSHLTLEIVLDFIGIPIELRDGGFFDPAKVRRRGDGLYDLVFPANSDEVVSQGNCRTKGVPPDTIFTDPEIDIQLCALVP